MGTWKWGYQGLDESLHVVDISSDDLFLIITMNFTPVQMSKLV